MSDEEKLIEAYRMVANDIKSSGVAPTIGQESYVNTFSAWCRGRALALETARESDIRIGRGILKRLDLPPRNDDLRGLRLGKAAREAVDAERGKDTK